MGARKRKSIFACRVFVSVAIQWHLFFRQAFYFSILILVFVLCLQPHFFIHIPFWCFYIQSSTVCNNTTIHNCGWNAIIFFILFPIGYQVNSTFLVHMHIYSFTRDLLYSMFRKDRREIKLKWWICSIKIMVNVIYLSIFFDFWLHFGERKTPRAKRTFSSKQKKEKFNGLKWFLKFSTCSKGLEFSILSRRCEH